MVKIKTVVKWIVGLFLSFWIIGAIIQESSWFKVYCMEETYYSNEQCDPIKQKAFWALSTGNQKMQIDATLEAHIKHCLKPAADNMISSILSSIK